MLERYVHVCCELDFPMRLCKDSYFDLIEPWLNELELGLDAPLNTDVIKETLIQGLTENPELKILKRRYARYKKAGAAAAETETGGEIEMELLKRIQRRYEVLTAAYRD